MMFKKTLRNKRYLLNELIDKNEIRKVYLAYDKIKEKNVIIEVFNKSLSTDPIFIKNMRKQIEKILELDSTNIVSYNEYGLEKNRFFIVSEYVDSKTLYDYIEEKGSFALFEIIRIIKRIILVLKKANENKIINHNLNPNNIYILSSRKLKLSGFTPSFSFDDEDKYMPPNEEPSIKSNIYSLGILVKEMLGNYTNGKIEKVINKATNISKRKRYKDLEEFYNALVEVKDEDLVPIIGEEKKEKNKLIWLLFAPAMALLFGLSVTRFDNKVLVPDVTGYTVSGAKKKLQAKGFKVGKKVKMYYTNDVKSGRISKTYPKAEIKVEKGSEVTLYRTSTDDEFLIDDYTGKKYDDIYKLLEAKGFKVLLHEVEDDKEEGIILSQSQLAGTLLGKNSTIVLTVSKAKSLPENTEVVKASTSSTTKTSSTKRTSSSGNSYSVSGVMTIQNGSGSTSKATVITVNNETGSGNSAIIVNNDTLNKIESSNYNIKEIEVDGKVLKIILGADDGVKIGDFLSNLDNKLDSLKVYDNNGAEIDPLNEVVKTGIVLKLDGSVADEAIVVVRGDVNGDGLVDATDAMLIRNQVLGKNDIVGYNKYAADVENDEQIDLSDCIKLADYIVSRIDTLNSKE